MRYAVIQITEGASFLIKSEYNDLEKAKTGYHQTCASVHNDKGFFRVTVALVDENLDVVEGRYKELIVHEETPETTEE